MRKRLWLFHAVDFQSLMYPCLTIGGITGAFPYQINEWTFKISKSRYILSTIIICIYCISLLIMLYDFGNINYETFNMRNNFQIIIKCIETNFYYTCCVFMTIVSQILCYPRMRLLQTIMKISSKLSIKKYQELSRLIHIKDIFGSLILIVMWYLWINRIKNLFRIKISYIIVSVYTPILLFQYDMLYINCVYILNACLKEINNNLLHIKELLIKKERRIRDVFLFYHEQRNLFLIMEIKALKKQHLMINNAVQTLNTIFSFQLLTTIGITLTEFIFELYFNAVQWHGRVSFNWKENSYDLFLISLSFDVIKIILLVWSCETSKNQAQKIGTTIHDVLNSINDEQIKDELQLFSLQIWHHKNTRFSTKTFNIDATLLTKVSNQLLFSIN
ncbi:hypothetical protein P5V15_009560 [Pogonomyrmex californicus]